MDYFKKPVQQLNFESILDELAPLSKGAKVHFMWKFVQTFSPGMCRTIIRYLHQRLNTLNSLPAKGIPYDGSEGEE